MATSKYGIAKFQSAIKTSMLPPQDQQNPVHNNNPNSSANGTYNYNPTKQRAQEPVITSTDGTQSAKIEPHEQKPGSGSGVLRLQSGLANRSIQRDVQQPQTVPNSDVDGRANLTIPDQLGYERNNYREMVEYTQKQANKDFGKMALYSALSNLGGSISGANARYQEYWSGGLVK